jgi:outer membrane protein assembly factor BamB
MGGRRWVPGCLVVVLAAAGCQGMGQEPVVPLRVGKPPAVSPAGGRVRARWQAGPLYDEVVAGDLVVGATGGAAPVVVALRAANGEVAWRVPLPARVPEVMAVVAADGVVVVQGGRDVGAAPAAVRPAATEDLVLDARTGHRLWSVPVSGGPFAAQVAVGSGLVLTGKADGTVAARVARTGAVRWWMGSPAWCAGRSADSLWRTASLAVNDGLIAAAEFCASGASAVVRVDPASGRLLWSRPVSAAADGGTPEPLTVAGVTAQPGAAGQSGVVVVAGELKPGQAGASRTYPAPAGLGPTDTRQALLALDAGSGQPLWTAATGPADAQVQVTGGAVCRSPLAGVECRDARTGAPLWPALATGQATGPGPPNSGDAYAGAATTVLAVTLTGPAASPSPPGRGVLVRLLPLRGQAAIDVRVKVATQPTDGSNEGTFVVAAGPVTGGDLILLRRVDVTGYPLVALLVAPA